jgi:putative transposase
MKRKQYSDEQILSMLKEHKAGMKVQGLVRKYGVSEQSFYRWRTKFGGMDVSEARRLKELERENGELKKMVAELSLDNRMLKDLNSKKW